MEEGMEFIKHKRTCGFMKERGKGREGGREAGMACVPMRGQWRERRKGVA